MLITLISASAVLAVTAALGTSSPTAIQATGQPVPVVAEELSYPYTNASRIGPWGFTTSHSTDYVAWRFFERDVAFHSTMSGPNGRAGKFGEPVTWAANAATIGFKVDTAPRAGSIAHWGAGEQGAGSAGHVAYVERVNADGSVVISEFNLSVEHGYSKRGEAGTSPVRAPRYIHIRD